MKDLIRSPLQFVRPMTDDEWQDLVLRASHREIQRMKRRLSQRKPSRLELISRGSSDRLPLARGFALR